MKILLLDNYDSFTYNLVHYLESMGAEVEIFRNDEIEIEEVKNFDKIVLSPGPGIPDQAGILKAIIKEDRKSTRLNSSHVKISYAVFCLKKKKKLKSTKTMARRIQRKREGTSVCWQSKRLAVHTMINQPLYVPATSEKCAASADGITPTS